jgi:hypothetical protein
MGFRLAEGGSLDVVDILRGEVKEEIEEVREDACSEEIIR